MTRWREFMLLLSVLSALSIGVARADTRLLVSFDDTGHAIQKTYSLLVNNSQRSFELHTANVATIHAKRVAKTRDHNGIDARRPLVSWYNSANEVILHENVVDPRFSHAPIGASSELRQYVKSSGVYMLTAPEGAVRFVLRLPELAIDNYWTPAEQWDLPVRTP